MATDVVPEIEKVLCELERAIDSTYCGTKHSVIYNLVEKALTIIESERVRADLRESDSRSLMAETPRFPEPSLTVALQSLPAPERHAYVLKEHESFSISAIAENMSVAPAKVIVLIHQARNRLLAAGVRTG